MTNSITQAVANGNDAGGLQSALAKRFGVSAAAVTGWVKDGMPTDSADAAESWVRVNRPKFFSTPVDHSIATAGVDDEGPRGAYARAREVERAAYNAAMSEPTAANVTAHARAAASAQEMADVVLKWETACGNVVSVEEMKTAWVRFFALLRAELDGMPTRLSERIGGNSEPTLRDWRDRILLRLGRSQPFGESEPEELTDE